MKKGNEMEYKPWLSIQDIKKAIVIAFVLGCLFFGPFVLLSQYGWYRSMGKFFHENPLILAAIVVDTILVVLVITVLTRDRIPSEDDES